MHSVGTPQYQQKYHPESDHLYIYIYARFKIPQWRIQRKKKEKKRGGSVKVIMGSRFSGMWNEIYWFVLTNIFWIMCFFVAWSNLHGKNCVWGSCDWTTTLHAKMNLAMEVQHTDFSHHCKDQVKERHILLLRWFSLSFSQNHWF